MSGQWGPENLAKETDPLNLETWCRVTHLAVGRLGLVDLELYCSTVFPTLPLQHGKTLKSKSTKHRSTIRVNPLDTDTVYCSGHTPETGWTRKTSP